MTSDDLHSVTCHLNNRVCIGLLGIEQGIYSRSGDALHMMNGIRENQSKSINSTGALVFDAIRIVVRSIHHLYLDDLEPDGLCRGCLALTDALDGTDGDGRSAHHFRGNEF